jgi:membrane-associated phospholipid phosphatase
MNPFIFFDYIGLYAYIILFFFSIILLRNKTNYLKFFIAGFIFNNLLNNILKLLFKEPRPTKDQKAIEIGVNNGIRIGYDKFGMPSGHAQNCAYCLAFIFMTLHNIYISLFYLVITIITIFQRYKYNNHTIFQLFIGFIIGSCVGYSIYLFANKIITGDITIKQDDYGPL